MLQNKIIIAIFALILALPALDNIFHFSPVKDLFEKRKLQQMPPKPDSLEALQTYPKNFENFFNDNYGFRKSFIAWHGKIMDNIFGESPSSRALIGKDEWLFFDNQNSLLDAQGRAKIDENLINNSIEYFAKNWQELRAKNIDYLLVIAADKSSIYPEFLPDYIKPNSQNHRIDKFLDALKAKYPDFPVLDLRQILLKAKEKEIVYQKTDTHHNRRGAHYSYVEIMQILAKKNPQLKPHLREDFIDKQDEFTSGDIAKIMGLDLTNLNYDLVKKFPQNFVEIEASEDEKKQFYHPKFFVHKDKNLPISFVYHDSFFDDIQDYFAEHFSKSFLTNQYPCEVDLAAIKKYKADIVIHQFWEGRIEEVLKSCGR